MTTAIRTGLTRITVSAPRRRIDLVLPDHLPVSDLLPVVLEYAGEGAADDAEKHGGFDLRRTDGKTIDPSKSMAMQQVRDGELLHLAPRHADWPEGEYDDVVEAIAAGAKQLGKPWEGNHTRVTGLTIAGIAAMFTLGGMWLAGPSWTWPGAAALIVGAVLLVIGTALSRTTGDSVAGAALGAFALPFAAFGGYVILGGDWAMTAFSTPHLLVAAASLLTFSTVGFYVVGEALRVFTAGITAGFMGLVAAAIGFAFSHWSTAAVAAATISLTVMFLPMVPSLSMKFSKLPMPELPQSAKDLVKDTPNPPKEEVFAKVLRADEILTGLILGVSITTILSMYVVDRDGIPAAAPMLVGIVGAVFLLRARLFPAVRQRVPLLATGIIGTIFTAMGFIGLFGTDLYLLGLLLIVLPFVLLAVSSGLIYSKRAPSPYIGRIADIVDVLLITSVVPVAVTAMGLFSWFRGLLG
ncbi:MAG: type VII secretion integral membrane protein EccD [Stackebrandtia sp.]